MRAVDTNVVVRLITRDDMQQVERAERFVEAGGWISLLVLAEVTWVLSSVYELSPEKIATAVEMLLNHERLALQDPDTVAAALERFRSRSAVGFSDCLILEIARKAGYKPLGTFDREFGRFDGAELL